MKKNHPQVGQMNESRKMAQNYKTLKEISRHIYYILSYGKTCKSAKAKCLFIRMYCHDYSLQILNMLLSTASWFSLSFSVPHWLAIALNIGYLFKISK